MSIGYLHVHPRQDEGFYVPHTSSGGGCRVPVDPGTRYISQDYLRYRYALAIVGLWRSKCT